VKAQSKTANFSRNFSTSLVFVYVDKKKTQLTQS